MKFKTDDGYVLNPRRRDGKMVWTDGDMTFLTDRSGDPVDDRGNKLTGVYVPDPHKCAHARVNEARICCPCGQIVIDRN